MAELPRRVTVTHPRTQAARPALRHAVVRDVREQTALGEVYVKALIRSQLRLGLLICAAVCLPLACLPPLLAYVPLLREGRLWGVGLPWLILGLPVYALLVAAGAGYVRRAERNERDFAENVHRS